MLKEKPKFRPYEDEKRLVRVDGVKEGNRITIFLRKKSPFEATVVEKKLTKQVGNPAVVVHRTDGGTLFLGGGTTAFFYGNPDPKQ